MLDRQHTGPAGGTEASVAELVQFIENAQVPLAARHAGFKAALPHLTEGALMHSQAASGQGWSRDLNWLVNGRLFYPDWAGHDGCAASMTLPGYLASKSQWELLGMALDASASRGRDPLAVHLSDGRRVGLVQQMCMEHATASHALHQTLDALQFPLSVLQSNADALYRSATWSGPAGRERVQKALAGHFTDNDQVVAMAALAAHGVQFDVTTWTVGGNDPLTRMVLYREAPLGDPRLDRLHLAGIEHLASQGFGRQVKRLTDGPLHIAAKRLDVDVLASLLHHDFDPQAQGVRGATPAEYIANNTVPLDNPSRSDRLDRCATLLRAATARQAARQALAAFGWSDSPA